MSQTTHSPDEHAPDDQHADTPVEQTTELAVLREENNRLRAEYRRARQHQHRQSALALAGTAVLALAAALLFSSAREVLFVLAAIGGFGAILTYYLTPDRVTTASVVDAIHDTHAETIASITEELGLQDARLYLPTADPTLPARLFVPQHTDFDIPGDPEDVFVVTETDAERGVSLPPVGVRLLESLEPATPETDSAEAALALATDSLAEQFELVSGVDYDLADGRATVTVSEPRPRDLTTPDHPVVSLCAVVLATTLDTPVRLADCGVEQATFTWNTG